MSEFSTTRIEPEQLRRLVQDEAMKLPDMGLVVSGLAGRFPKADSVNEFEAMLYEGTDMVNDQDCSRFDCGLWGLPPRAGRLKDLSRFDCEFFGFAPDEANFIDFQQRILYEVVYESILDAGVNPAALRGTNTGVFFGLHCNEFENAMADDPSFKTNGYYAQYAVKVAQYFDLRGLTVTFDAACASVFVALHNAVEAINEGHCDQAIVCSCNIPIHPTAYFIFLQMQMLSPTGYSRFLDSRADGYVKSEACVSILVQRKQVALRNYASFLSTQTSVDGYKREGITFPSDACQERLIRQTKERARVSTNHIEYLEAHGTGTPAGDPQESRAIANVYFPADPSEERRIIGPLLVGSVKTNMGHSEAASGLCALAKVVLMLENELIYKSLHFEKPNLNIESLKEGKIKFTGEANAKLTGKIIPLSCYGFGGSNVHVILRASEQPAIWDERQLKSNGNNNGNSNSNINSPARLNEPRLVLMFGRSERALNEMFDELLSGTRQTRNCLSDDYLMLLDGLNAGPLDRLMNYRGYLVLDRATDRELARAIGRCDLEPILGGARSDDDDDERDLGRRAHLQDARERPCHLILPGMGSEWPGMAAGLQEFVPFWSTIERLARVLEPFDDVLELRRLLAAGRPDGPDDQQAAAAAAAAPMAAKFVSIIAYQVALINLVRDQLKVKNLGSIVGHSLGEISAAYAAGLLDERETILVAYRLGKTLDDNRRLIEGKMVAIVGLSEPEVRNKLAARETCDICCINSELSHTVSGRAEEVDSLCEQLAREGGSFVKLIDPTVALHNPKIMGAEIRAKLRASVECVLFPGRSDLDIGRTRWIPSVAQLDGRSIEQANGEYFADSLCERVDFSQAIARLDGDSICLELGPSGPFESQLRNCPAPIGGGGASSSSAGNDETTTTTISKTTRKSNKFHYVKLMKANTPRADQVLSLLKHIGELYHSGARMNLINFYHGFERLQAPVRRQTPSLSSLLKWNHEQAFFVPRYPVQFGKSSAKSEMPVDIVQDRDKYLTGHCIEGRILFPATGYLFMVWRVFSFTLRKVYDSSFQDVVDVLAPVEFRNVRLLRAIILGNLEAQIYIHLEEATGRFEVKEGGSVVAEGYVRSPSEKPDELLYEDVRTRIQSERLELTLNEDDVYKQFRVSGYDYGETFRNIVQASADGRHCRVKFNGHFIALTDSILQSIFLAITQYAPSGGLFLPTCFEYVRFQPEVILKKVRAAKMVFDLSEGSLSSKEKRVIMTKMMEREPGMPVDLNNEPAEGEKTKEEEEAKKKAEEAEAEEEKPVCIFETFCDPVTGIIITDGIEMRGIKASPAPRRVDHNAVLMESYQFVRDCEDPIEDEPLTQFRQNIAKYTRVCDSMSVRLLQRLLGGGQRGKQGAAAAAVELLSLPSDVKPLDESKCENYIKLHELMTPSKADLVVRKKDSVASSSSGGGGGGGKRDDDKQEAPARDKETTAAATSSSSSSSYNIKKNGNKMLLSVLNELLIDDDDDESIRREPKQLRELVQRHKFHLMKDLIQTSFTSERTMRPIIEGVIENCCTRKKKLKLLEINPDDGLMREPLSNLIQSIEPGLNLDYSLAHPDPDRLTTSKLLAASSGGGAGGLKTYTLRDVRSLFSEQHLKDLDAIVYKDISCYSLPKQVVEENGLSPVMSSLNGAVGVGGYVILIMRSALTFAERVLLALGEPELVGLSERNLSEMKSAGAMQRIERINSILQARCKQMLDEAERNGMVCVARKSDANGCSVLAFRSTSRAINHTIADKPSGIEKEIKVERILMRVSHEDQQSIASWLERLKEFFKPAAEEEEAAAAAVADETNEAAATAAKQRETDELAAAAAAEQERAAEKAIDPKDVIETKRIVWLCSVASKGRPISGLIGMMQALRREVGSDQLRCYYDDFTFRHSSEPITMDQIEACPRFKQALRRDQLWNCVNWRGEFGSFRHLTINEYMNYEDCKCANNKLDLLGALDDDDDDDDSNDSSGNHEGQSKWPPAFVNHATRGDLSSFAWFEGPYLYLQPDERRHLVRVAYSAMNFRDVMLATGRLPLDAVPAKLAMSDCQLGLEFSGIDAEGRRVFGTVPSRGLATHTLCYGSDSMKLYAPDWLSLKDAATIPAVYITVLLALKYRGHMKAGETILVHAGSGGVGQAAIRVAAHFGLTVYTTCGTDEKRQFLLDEFPGSLDASRIFSSRDCDFEWKIMQATRGRGVDLVLNSLADDKLQASVRCLADGGRFLEIGKYDMAIDARLELLRLDTNKTFHGILLDKLFEAEDEHSQSFREMLPSIGRDLEQGLRDGYVKPIRSTVFRSDQVEEAFRYMATGKHIGKVLIEINKQLDIGPINGSATTNKLATAAPAAAAPTTTTRMPKCVPRFQLSPEKSYIVTGGLGGFGLELIKWLVGQGARRLLVTSRQGLRTGYQRATLERLQRINGAKFLVVTEQMADTTQASGCERLYELALEMSPISQVGGLFHLAMVLKDGLLENMTVEDFELVCRPKVDTCVHLDELSRELRARGRLNELDYFVCFSSITSGKGNAGQTNYAYANSCLERVCERRRDQFGQHGLAIQWGAIGDVGVAFENLGGNDVVIGGTIPQRMPSCLATLGRLLCGPFATCLSVLPVSRRSADGGAEKGDLVAAIMHVLGIKDPSKVNESATLGELGLDSLMAVEIRQYIEREYEMTLNIQEIRALTIAKIREIGEKEPGNRAAMKQQHAAAAAAASDQAATTKGDDGRGATAAAAAEGPGATIANGRAQSQGYGGAAKAALKLKAANKAIEAEFDRRLVNSFVPQLKLPSEPFRRLNGAASRINTSSSSSGHANNGGGSRQRNGLNNGAANGLSNSDSGSSSCSGAGGGGGLDAGGRPIFFIPPVHGEFTQLEPLCAKLERPCIGLEWTAKLGKAADINEACELYLSQLAETNWAQEFCFDANQQQAAAAATAADTSGERRVVDLVGYSYGATIAFEMLLKLHLEPGKYSNLRPGKLVLLDGSPKQIELGSHLLADLSRKRPLQRIEKLDELLMVYLMAHTTKSTTTTTRKPPIDYIGFKRQLASTPLEQKGKLVGELLLKYLDPKLGAKVDEITDAMEAFCRRYELISEYKTKADCFLPTGCTLVRAEKLFLAKTGATAAADTKYNEDFGLSTVVRGKVDLFVMSGDHDTFLIDNHAEISRIVANGLRA